MNGQAAESAGLGLRTCLPAGCVPSTREASQLHLLICEMGIIYQTSAVTMVLSETLF